MSENQGRRQARRITGELTAAQQEALKQVREQVAKELPELIARDRLRKEAAEETTLSGELRRGVHASELSITQIAARTGISLSALDQFLTGERTLRSDVLDRLAKTLGYEFNCKPGAPPSPAVPQGIAS